MKKFILLSFNITGMGGGQMYQYNKLKFMKTHGYDTYVINATPGEVVIKDFGSIAKILDYPIINVDPRLLSKKILCKNIESLNCKVGGISENTIIECDGKTIGLWGEILASRYKCLSHILIIDERIGSMDNGLLDFFSFKRDNYQLKGLKDETYEMIFGRTAKADFYDYKLNIASNNVVQDIDYEFVKEQQGYYDLKICSIGRLDKGYIPSLIKEVKHYSKEHSTTKILFGLIGDSSDARIRENIIQQLSGVNNLSLILYGSVYPIPLRLLNYYDIFISSAGSARVSGNLGIPTITIDARDYMGIGVFQITTENTVFRESEETVPISTLIEYVVANYSDIKSKMHKRDNGDFEKIYKTHLEYYDSLKIGSYYNFYAVKLGYKRKIEKLLFRILGTNKYLALKKYVFERSYYE